MRATSNYDSSWAVELVQTVVSRADSLSEGTECLQAVTALLNLDYQQSQSKRDDERRGYLMNEILRVSPQLGIASNELRSLKAMTTSKLEAYADELYRQLGTVR